MPFGPIVQKRTPTLFAGRFRHRIDIVQISSVQDSTGGTSLANDVLYANVWASIEALSGTDKFAAHEFISQVTHQIVIRYIGAAPSWLPQQNYIGQSLVKDSNGNLQQAQSGGGVSGAVAPTWNTNTGGTTQDGNTSTGVLWKNLGKAPLRTGVTAGMQVRFQERVFQIESTLNTDERNKMLILMCLEINDSRQQSSNVSSIDLT